MLRILCAFVCFMFTCEKERENEETLNSPTEENHGKQLGFTVKRVVREKNGREAFGFLVHRGFYPCRYVYVCVCINCPGRERG